MSTQTAPAWSTRPELSPLVGDPDRPSAQTVAVAPPPSLQEIMDEAFARKLYEDDCHSLAMLVAAEANDSEPATSELFSDLEEARSPRELWGAHSFAVQQEEGSEHVEQADGAVVSVSASASAKLIGSTRSSKPSKVVKPLLDRSDDVSDLRGTRERFRRMEKQLQRGGAGRVEGEQFATRGSVLDTRTTLMLQKLINRGDLDEIHGCVQSGKEANVFYARATDEETQRPRHCAVKIFKTTLNAFSNRHEYVTGDRRFDLAFQKKDTRRQLQSWTEKEYRNLCRASRCIRAPTPFTFKEHIVVMSYIGEPNQPPAPTLKEATLSRKQLMYAYVDVLLAVRTLFHDAKLVHSDLSEYNILYFHQRCWFIDFGQAVDHTHPEYLTYLRRDLDHVHRFFTRAGLADVSEEEVGVLSVENSFEFVTTENPKAVVHAYPQLKELMKNKLF